jgi:arginyl-tRNA synthetase
MLLQPLSQLVGQIFKANGLPETLGRVIVADRPDLADVQCNGALQAAKLAGKPPRAIAEQIVAGLNALAENPFADIAIAGPGFLNFKLKPDYVARSLMTQSADKKFGLPNTTETGTILLEYVSPNVAKDLHVGHMRNLMIGDAIRRMLEYTGCKVVTDNHLGDWGLPMGMLLSEMQRRYGDLPYFQEGFTGPFPQQPPFDFRELCRIYPVAAERAKNDKAEMARAQDMTAKLQNSHPGYRALWQHIVDLSVADMREKIALFGARFDTWYGESYMDQFIPFILQDLKAKGIAEEIDGALGIHIAQEDDKTDIPPLILEKKMGGVTYAATDIATVYQREKDFHPAKIIYLTDFRQELHFERFFRAARKAGYAKDAEFVHIMYGTINGKDGKPFKTRDGGVPSFDYLVGELLAKARERLHEIDLDKKLSSEELEKTAEKIGLASIKFGDLINHRRSDYSFDLDKFVSFEGKTGPYVQYTVVRLNALLQRAHDQNIQAGAFTIDSAQHDAALLLLQFPEMIAASLEDYTPHLLCDYLFRLAQSVNRFYQNVPVLIETDVNKRAAALALLDLSAKILTQGLELIGIDVPNQM